MTEDPIKKGDTTEEVKKEKNHATEASEQMTFKEYITAEIGIVEVARDELVNQCEAKQEEGIVEAVDVISVTTRLDRAFEEFKTFALAKLVEDGEESEKKRQVAEKRAETMSAIKQHGRSLDRSPEEGTLENDEADVENSSSPSSEQLSEIKELLAQRKQQLDGSVKLSSLLLDHEGFSNEEIESISATILKMRDLVFEFEAGIQELFGDKSNDAVAIKKAIEAAYEDTNEALLELTKEEIAPILKNKPTIPYDPNKSSTEEAVPETTSKEQVTQEKPESPVKAEEDEEHEHIIGDNLTIDSVSAVGDVIGAEILVKKGATLSVFGDLEDSIIRIETGGNFKFKGEENGKKIKNSDIIENYVQTPPKAESTEAPVEPASAEDTATASTEEKSSIIPDIPTGHEATVVGGGESSAEKSDKPDSTESSSESETVEFSQDELEKQLGYLDIHPMEIFNSLEIGEIKQLQFLMGEYREAEKAVAGAKREIEIAAKPTKKDKDGVAEQLAKLEEKVAQAKQELADAQEKIVNFYKQKIKEILANTGKEDLLSDEELRKVSEKINKIIQQSIEAAAQQEVARLNIKKIKSLAVRSAVDAALIMAGSFGITALTGGVGALASVGISSSAVSGMRLLLRKLRGKREQSKYEENRAKEKVEVDKKKDEYIRQLFEDTDIVARQLSGHISNIIREQTSGVALETLRNKADEAADLGQSEVLDSTLSKMEKELYKAALVQVEAQYPHDKYLEITAAQRHNMAVQLAMTLGQHERGENEAKQKLKELQAKNPAVYNFIQKYNLLSSGKPDIIPDDASDSDKKFWAKHKYDIYSFLIGTSVGVAARMEGTTRVVLGAVGGAGMGHMVAEDIGRRQEQKAIAEIGAMLKESEVLINDVSFPVDQLEKLRQDSIFVQSKLDLGILDGNPLLKSRAENFIHNVRKIEMRNQETLDSLLEQIKTDSQALEEQVNVDVSRIEKHTKRRKILFMVGGAILGGSTAFFGPGLFNKALGRIMGSDQPDGVATNSKDGTNPQEYDGRSDWKSDETDHWKTGREDIDDVRSRIAGAGADDASAQADAEGATGVEEGLVEKMSQPTHFEDTIDSSKVAGGSDSIWRSTRAIFSGNAEALGYKGDVNDTEAIARWAESQTAAVVNKLNAEQGGNLADLVHDGDVVKLDLVDGQPKLSFEASSGIKAGNLSDTNVEKFFSETKFEEGIEPQAQIDPETGDQFVTLQTDEGIIKIYDWDRDGNPDVVMPNGSHQEMKPEQLRTFMEQHNVSMTAEEMTAQEERLADLLKMEEIKGEIGQFLEGKSDYSSEMYSVAKIEGKLDDVLHQLLSEDKSQQLEQFINDYFKDHNMANDKKAVFVHELAKLYGTDELRNYPGNMNSLLAAFDANLTNSYEELEGAFKSVGGDKEWVPTKVGENYALVRRDTGFMRAPRYYIDTDGDGQPESIKIGDGVMKEVFENKRPLGNEGVLPETKTPDLNEKTFSLKRPEVPAAETTPDPAVESKIIQANPDKIPEPIPRPAAGGFEIPKAEEVVDTPVAVEKPIVMDQAPAKIRLDITPEAAKIMSDRGIAFKGGNLHVPGMDSPIVFSKEAADSLGIETQDSSVTDSISFRKEGDYLHMSVINQDGTVENLVLDKDNNPVESDAVSADVPPLAEITSKGTDIPETAANLETPMDPIDYAVGTINAGKENLDFQLDKINDYDLDYLKSVKAFTEAQLAAIGEDTTNPRALALRQGMKIIDDEVALRIKGFEVKEAT